MLKLTSNYYYSHFKLTFSPSSASSATGGFLLRLPSHRPLAPPVRSVPEVVLVVYRNPVVPLLQVLLLVDSLQVRRVRLDPGLLLFLVLVVVPLHQLARLRLSQVLLRVQVEQSEARVNAQEDLVVHRLAAPQARGVRFAQLPLVEAHQAPRVPVDHRAVQQFLESNGRRLLRLYVDRRARPAPDLLGKQQLRVHLLRPRLLLVLAERDDFRAQLDPEFLHVLHLVYRPDVVDDRLDQEREQDVVLVIVARRDEELLVLQQRRRDFG